MYTYNIELLRVVDGDTIDAKIDLGFDVSIKKRDNRNGYPFLHLIIQLKLIVLLMLNFSSTLLS